MRVNVCDFHDSLYVTAFKEAQKLVGMPPHEYARLNEEERQAVLKELRGKEVKLKLVTKSE